MSRFTLKAVPTLGALWSLAIASAAHAPGSGLEDRYWFEAQAYWPDVNTTVSTPALVALSAPRST